MLCLKRQALVNRKAAGSLFTTEILGREEAESKEPKIRELKKLCVVCVCVCVCVDVGPKGATHTKVPPWSMRTQGWPRELHMGLNQTVRRVKSALHPPSYTVQRQVKGKPRLQNLLVYSLPSFNPQHNEEL